jgi:hypothetical protein
MTAPSDEAVWFWQSLCNDVEVWKVMAPGLFGHPGHSTGKAIMYRGKNLAE